MTHLPKFSAALLHPRYWLLWLGIGLLWLVVQLPYPLIYRLGTGLGRYRHAANEAPGQNSPSQSGALFS